MKIKDILVSKQTFDLSAIEIERKTRQNAENKQTFGLTEKPKLFYAKNLISTKFS